MPVIYEDDTATARMLATRDRIDSGGAAGVLEICSAGYANVLSAVALGYPGNATAIVSARTLTLAGLPRSDVAIDATGQAALARIRNSAGAIVLRGLTVGVAGSGADVILNRTDLVAGRPLTINSAAFTHA